MRRTTQASAVLVVLCGLAGIAGCATPGAPGAAAPPVETTTTPPDPVPEETMAATTAPQASEPVVPLTGAESADQLFDHVAGVVDVPGTEFHQIRYTPAEDGRTATVLYGTAQWEAHVADNSQPIGPIVAVHASARTRTEVVEASAVPAAAASRTAADPLAPLEPEGESPSGQEQRLIVVPAPSGEGTVIIATTGLSDDDARAFAEAVTR